MLHGRLVRDEAFLERFARVAPAIARDPRNAEMERRELLVFAPWVQVMTRFERELYRDPEFGFIQMGHVHKQGHGNKPHDHGPCWVVYGSFSGVTEITKYKRIDDGSEPGIARLEKERLDRLTPGVVVPYLPGDIHSTHAAEGPGVVFRFLSYDLEKIARNRYNPEKNTIARV